MPENKQKSSSKAKVVLHTKTIRGLKTGWLESGKKSKPILLFLHGFPDDAHVWDEQIAYFKKQYHIVAPFLRGVGQSVAPKKQQRYNMDAVALDILTILRHVDPEAKKNIIIIGHDIGSPVAWHLAALLGKRLKGLVIINGANSQQFFERLKKNYHQAVKSWYMYFFFLPYLPELVLKLAPLALKKKLLLSGGMPPKHIKQAQDGLKSSPNLVRHYRSIFYDFINSKIHNGHTKMDAPVLSISSLEDKFVEPASIMELEEHTFKPIVRIVEGHHWIQLEDPEHINKLIEKFLDQDCKIVSQKTKVNSQKPSDNVVRFKIVSA